MAGLVDRLAELSSAADDAERIDRIAVLERLKAAAYAAQLVEVVEFAASQEAANRAAGVRARAAARGIAAGGVGAEGVAGVGGSAGGPGHGADRPAARDVRPAA